MDAVCWSLLGTARKWLPSLQDLLISVIAKLKFLFSLSIGLSSYEYFFANILVIRVETLAQKGQNLIRMDWAILSYNHIYLMTNLCI